MDADLVPVRFVEGDGKEVGQAADFAGSRSYRMMIFVPILLLQITIFFWSYRIGRIVYKLVKGTSATE